MEREQRDDCETGEHGVDAEQIPDVAGVVTVRVDRDAVDEARERDSPHKRCSEAPDGVRRRPRRTANAGSRSSHATRTRRRGRSGGRGRGGGRGRSRRTSSRTRREMLQMSRLAATTNHTSLPSQTGAIDLSSAPLSSSVRGTNGRSIPTPKSNPSSTKYPAQRTAMRTNQRVSRSTQYVTAGTANSSSSPPTSGGSTRA